jgi:hypothetical protein
MAQPGLRRALGLMATRYRTRLSCSYVLAASGLAGLGAGNFSLAFSDGLP